MFTAKIYTGRHTVPGVLFTQMAIARSRLAFLLPAFVNADGKIALKLARPTALAATLCLLPAANGHRSQFGNFDKAAGHYRLYSCSGSL